MDGQLRHLLAQRLGQVAPVVYGLQSVEQLEGGDEVAGGRSAGELEADQVVDAQRLQLQDSQARE